MSDPLLTRALGIGLKTAPDKDFTRRILEHIAREECRRERRENRMLLAGAVVGSAGLIILAIVVVHTYADSGIFASLQTALQRAGSFLPEVFRSDASAATHGSGWSADKRFLLSVWGFMAGAFLVFGCAEQLLRRKRR